MVYAAVAGVPVALLSGLRRPLCCLIVGRTPSGS